MLIINYVLLTFFFCDPFTIEIRVSLVTVVESHTGSNKEARIKRNIFMTTVT